MTVTGFMLDNVGDIYTAADVRRLHDVVGLTRYTTLDDADSGVIHRDDLAVTERGAGANMSVDVAAGPILIRGTTVGRGTYLLYSDAVTNLAISDGDASNPRIDLVVAKITETAYGDATDSYTIEVIEGTPAASPAAPAVPDYAVALCEIAVAANESTSVTNADLTERRSLHRLATLPRGQLAEAALAANASISSVTTATGLSVTAALAGGRRYRISLFVDARADNNDSLLHHEVRLDATGGTAVKTYRQPIRLSGGQGRDTRQFDVTYEPAADGSHSFHLIGLVEFGGGAGHVLAGTRLRIDDVGAVPIV